MQHRTEIKSPRLILGMHSPAWADLPITLTMMFADVFVIALAFLTVDLWQRSLFKSPFEASELLIWGGVWLFLRLYRSMYPGYGQSPQQELQMHVATTVQAAIIHFAATFAAHELSRSRLSLIVMWIFVFLITPIVRILVRNFLIKMGTFGRPVVIFGAGETAEAAVHYLLKNPDYGLKPVAIYDDNPDQIGKNILNIPIVGNFEYALKNPQVMHAIYCLTTAEPERKREILALMHEVHRITWATPDFFGIPNQSLQPHSMGAHTTFELRNNLLSIRAKIIKRVFDLVSTIFGGILISPILLILVVLIKLDSKGPVLYKARRLGLDGKEFFCYKFRSMHPDAEARLQDVLNSDPALKAEFEATHKLKNDPRVTRMGALMRKTSLDELPQLLNVLTGQMSLVGPRPIVQAEIAKYGEIYDTYTKVQPGMTGYWQANGRSDTTYDERVEMDRFYISNWDLWLDMYILLQTVRVVFMGKGAY